jgi:hypothetical protein
MAAINKGKSRTLASFAPDLNASSFLPDDYVGFRNALLGICVVGTEQSCPLCVSSRRSDWILKSEEHYSR